jgi:FdhD protein
MVTQEHATIIVTPEGTRGAQETVVQETPVEILLNDEPAGTAMVLPRDLEAFAVGHLFGQGRIEPGDPVHAAEVCDRGSRVSVHADVVQRPGEGMITTSGCGGTGRIAERLLQEPFPEPPEYSVTFQEIEELIHGTLSCSPLREQTHCIHGCGYLSEGGFQVCYEDVGRHNAVDKLLGSVLLGRLSHVGAAYTTGRLTSDMVLKCARMGVPVVLSRTAPSSLGVEIAQKAGLTLGCYVRPGRVNVFHAPERIRAS